jgi:precorrin-2 dehydrogenase/sirohydrochlorin ferrochelatase
MKTLPVALHVAGRPCLVVGGGPVAVRKAVSLLQCDAPVTLISPRLCDEGAFLRDSVTFIERTFQINDCAGFRLVFACTNSREVNEQITNEAQAMGALCNAADDPQASDFSSMAIVQRSEISVAISTGGGSPALARHLRERVETTIGPEYEVLLRLLSERRPELKENLAHTSVRAELWRAILVSDVLDLLRDGTEDAAVRRINEILGQGGAGQ